MIVTARPVLAIVLNGARRKQSAITGIPRIPRGLRGGKIMAIDGSLIGRLKLFACHAILPSTNLTNGSGRSS